jgi:sec-independent protein translocase protein TatC
MTFWEHLDELRGVLVRSAAVVLGLMTLCFLFASQLQEWLVRPFALAAAKVGPAAGQLALLSPTEGFLVRMKLAFFTGLLLGSPYLFLQIWGFVSPALHAKEKRLVLPVVGVASTLFLLGAAFGYFIMGIATEFLLRFSTPDIGNQWSLSSYLTFLTQIMLGLGLVFQLPLVLLFLMRLGLVTPAQLTHWRRHALVGILVAVALLPMQDPLSLVLMSAPLYLLYETSILAGRLLLKPRAERQHRPE